MRERDTPLTLIRRGTLQTQIDDLKAGQRRTRFVVVIILAMQLLLAALALSR